MLNPFAVLGGVLERRDARDARRRLAGRSRRRASPGPIARGFSARSRGRRSALLAGVRGRELRRAARLHPQLHGDAGPARSCRSLGLAAFAGALRFDRTRRRARVRCRAPRYHRRDPRIRRPRASIRRCSRRCRAARMRVSTSTTPPRPRAASGSRSRSISIGMAIVAVYLVRIYRVWRGETRTYSSGAHGDGAVHSKRSPDASRNPRTPRLSPPGRHGRRRVGRPHGAVGEWRADADTCATTTGAVETGGPEGLGVRLRASSLRLGRLGLQPEGRRERPQLGRRVHGHPGLPARRSSSPPTPTSSRRSRFSS